MRPESLLTSHHLKDFTETSAQASGALHSTAPPGKDAGTHEGALLIAADGIHSAVREKLYPQEGAPLLERPHPVARHHRERRVPVRPHHDHGRP